MKGPPGSYRGGRPRAWVAEPSLPSSLTRPARPVSFLTGFPACRPRCHIHLEHESKTLWFESLTSSACLTGQNLTPKGGYTVLCILAFPASPALPSYLGFVGPPGVMLFLGAPPSLLSECQTHLWHHPYGASTPPGATRSPPPHCLTSLYR